MDAGAGLFDFQEAAHLLGVTNQTIVRVCLGDGGSAPLVQATHGWALSFGDLVAASVVVTLRKRDVPYATLHHLKGVLADRLSIVQPFGHKAAIDLLGSAGTDLVADLGSGWESIPSHQLTLREPLETYLQRIQFGHDGTARRWVPFDRVLLDPEIQSGSPCVAGTRFETLEVFELCEQGYSFAEIARDFALELAGVECAVLFEKFLTEHVGIQSIAAPANR
jgi:uncharacterized protein (DUF433 family)